MKMRHRTISAYVIPWLSIVWFGFVKNEKFIRRVEGVVFLLTVSVNFVNMLNVKVKMNHKNKRQRSIRNLTLCFTSGEFCVMKSMNLRRREQCRKRTTASCHAEYNNNHPKGPWEFTSCKVFVLHGECTRRIGGPNNNAKGVLHSLEAIWSKQESKQTSTTKRNLHLFLTEFKRWDL